MKSKKKMREHIRKHIKICERCGNGGFCKKDIFYCKYCGYLNGAEVEITRGGLEVE